MPDCTNPALDPFPGTPSGSPLSRRLQASGPARISPRIPTWVRPPPEFPIHPFPTPDPHLPGARKAQARPARRRRHPGVHPSSRPDTRAAALQFRAGGRTKVRHRPSVPRPGPRSPSRSRPYPSPRSPSRSRRHPGPRPRPAPCRGRGAMAMPRWSGPGRRR